VRPHRRSIGLNSQSSVADVTHSPAGAINPSFIVEARRSAVVRPSAFFRF
jgi:hypothetical protein